MFTHDENRLRDIVVIFNTCAVWINVSGDIYHSIVIFTYMQVNTSWYQQWYQYIVRIALPHGLTDQ